MRTVLAIFLAALAALPAQAQPEDRPNWRSVRQKQWVCRDWGGCGYEWRWRRVRNHIYRLPERDPPREYGYRPSRAEEEIEYGRRDPRSERGIKCKDEVTRVIGGKHMTQAGAIKDAVGRWETSISYDHGERFMNMENARGYLWRCDKASTNETVLGRTAEGVANAITGGQAEAYYKRCVVIARPCMQPVQRGDEDKR